MKYFYGRPVSSRALSGSFSCLVGSFVRREKELKRKKEKWNTPETHAQYRMHTQRNSKIILKIKCVHLERAFCTSPCYPSWGSSQPCHSGRPSGGAFLSGCPSPASLYLTTSWFSLFLLQGAEPCCLPLLQGMKLRLPLHCALGETFSSNWSTAYLWDSLQPPGRAKQPEHTWEGEDPENCCLWGGIRLWPVPRIWLRDTEESREVGWLLHPGPKVWCRDWVSSHCITA